MTELEELVLGELKPGHHHAIPGRLLAIRLGYKGDRGIRLAIRSLIEQRHPILSSIKPPVGYFIAETQEEIKEYQEVLQSRILEDARRKRDIKLASRCLLQPGQLRLRV